MSAHEDGAVRERDLANLLIQSGIERGIELEEIVREIAAVRWPSFIDSQDLRVALLDQVEQHLRRQVDERIGRLRQEIATAPPGIPAPGEGDLAAITGPTLIEPDESAPASHANSGTAARPDLPDQAGLPNDATMIWVPDERPEG